MSYHDYEDDNEVESYLLWAVIATFFLLNPLGIIAIIYGAQVEGKVQSGDLKRAIDYSDKAKMWCIIAFASTLLIGIIYFIMTII